MNKSGIQNTLHSIENAKHVTKKLVDNLESIAIFIASQMQSLGLNSVLSGKYVMELHILMHRDQLISMGVKDTSLYLKIPGTSDENEFTVRLLCNGLSSTRELSILCGDYNAKYYKPSRQDALTFIADIPIILEELANCEKEDELTILDTLLKVIKSDNKAA
jgi:hypothetical protein